MIDEPTFFILGAGASKPYGFPTGGELKNQIVSAFPGDFAKLLDTDTNSRMPFMKEKRDAQVKDFLEQFKNSPIESIDRYLAINPKFSFYGKVAITYYIRQREVASNFNCDLNSPNCREDWLGLIFRHMTSSIKQPEDFTKFRGNKVAFITFNCDRSLEYRLCDSFCSTFCETGRDPQSLLSENIPFPIIPVYGQVGNLSVFGPWDDISSGYRDEDVNFKTIKALSRQIRIIGEASAEELKNQFRAIIANHKRIFFLGFGYAKENLDEINLLGIIDDKWQMFGTAIKGGLKL